MIRLPSTPFLVWASSNFAEVEPAEDAWAEDAFRHAGIDSRSASVRRMVAAEAAEAFVAFRDAKGGVPRRTDLFVYVRDAYLKQTWRVVLHWRGESAFTRRCTVLTPSSLTPEPPRAA